MGETAEVWRGTSPRKIAPIIVPKAHRAADGGERACNIHREQMLSVY